MRQQHWANSGERIHLAILARQIDVQASELATGFEPRIVKYRTMFRRFTCNHRAVLLEHVHRAVTLVTTTRKPFAMLAEGLLSRQVGATGFEPAASWSRTKRSTRLSYAPAYLQNSEFSGRYQRRLMVALHAQGT